MQTFVQTYPWSPDVDDEGTSQGRLRYLQSPKLSIINLVTRGDQADASLGKTYSLQVTTFKTGPPFPARSILLHW